jgi:hypothetical protein
MSFRHHCFQSMFIHVMARQSEDSLFETLIPKTKTTAVPRENLTPIPPLVEKHKEVAGERIVTQYYLRQQGQPIKAITHVCSLSRNKDTNRRGQA